VIDAENMFIWEYPKEDPSPAKRFQNKTCDSMKAIHKAHLEKWYTHLRNAFG
ncbi:hypothetical protein KI387_038485, partial [Taxus chinensis]